MKQLLLWEKCIYFEETHTTQTMPRRHVHVMEWLFQNNQQRGLHMKSIASSQKWNMYISTFFYKCTFKPSQECYTGLAEGVIEGWVFKSSRVSPPHVTNNAALQETYKFAHLSHADIRGGPHAYRLAETLCPRTGRRTTVCVLSTGWFSVDALKPRGGSTSFPFALLTHSLESRHCVLCGSAPHR